jgi:hypothetical protein
MFLRKITQDVSYPRAPADAFEDVCQALEQVGKLKWADESALAVKGTVRGGGWVVLEARVVPDADDRSVLSLTARCDDVWGAGARTGLAKVLGRLPYQADERGALVPAVAREQPPHRPTLGLTTVQQVSLALFLVFTSMASLDVAWGRGIFPLSLGWLYLLAALAGALAGCVLAGRRYLGPGLVGGAVAGLGGVAFSVLVFSHATSLYSLVAVATTLLGCLPGLLQFAALRALQHMMFPPRDPSAGGGPEE